MLIDFRKERESLHASLLKFTQNFYFIRTGRKFELSEPEGRESHYITICRALMKVMRGESKRLIINVPPRYGKCAHKMTRILTPDGIKYIKDIVPGDNVYSYDKDHVVIRPCLATERAFKRSLKIKMRSGREIIVSHDHPMLTTHGYKAAEDIKPKERIKTLNAIIDGSNRIDHDELTFITLMIFDGSCRKNIRFSKLEPSIINLFYETCSKLGIEVKQYDYNKPCDHHVMNKNGIARNILQKYDINNKLCYDKRLPLDWFAMPLEQKYWFFDLMFATDGYINSSRNGTCGITLANKGLIEDIQYLLSTIGIISTISFKSNDKANAWCLTINRENTQLLLNKITFLHKRYKVLQTNSKKSASTINNYPSSILAGLNGYRARQKGIRIDNKKDVNKDRFEKLCQVFPELEEFRNIDFYLDEVKSIEDVGEQELVHLQIHETENYIANGMVSHNTELLIHFVAWALSHYPDSNFLYVSYSLGLAKKQTKTIRQIIGMEEYRGIFGISISDEASAQGNFETSAGGSVFAAGADGEITGRGAGIKGANRFGGCIVIDDIHKPSEVTSDSMRSSVNDWYFNTLQSRVNEPDKTPIIFIGQRLHEDDLAANLIKSGEWETVIIPALDVVGNALHPQMHNREALHHMQETMPYVFSSQYQQDPMPAGGGIFKPEWFYLTDEEPEITATFITADTAETDKSYNDATVFSFFGVYKLKQHGIETDLTALHWLDCVELRIEPKDLENAFLAFYSACMRYKVRPRIAAIEKKSTGVTLLSVLKNVRGLQTIDIERTKSSGNKTTRFLEIQPYIASGQVSIPREGKHTQRVLEHMRKITANDSHRHDDIADTLYDSIKLGIIDNVIISYSPHRAQDEDRVARNIMGSFTKLLQLRGQRYGNRT